MRWTLIHKTLCVLALLAIGGALVVEYQLTQEKKGFAMPDSETLAWLLTVFTYSASIAGLIVAFCYGQMAQHPPRFFWSSLCLLVLGGLPVFGISFEYLWGVLFPRPKGLFDHLDWLGISTRRTQWIQYQNIWCSVWALLQLCAIGSLIRLRLLYRKRSSTLIQNAAV